MTYTFLFEFHFPHLNQCIFFFFLTFLLQLLAVALMKPGHLELGTLETHGTIELHEA